MSGLHRPLAIWIPLYFTGGETEARKGPALGTIAGISGLLSGRRTGRCCCFAALRSALEASENLEPEGLEEAILHFMHMVVETWMLTAPLTPGGDRPLYRCLTQEARVPFGPAGPDSPCACVCPHPRHTFPHTLSHTPIHTHTRNPLWWMRPAGKSRNRKGQVLQAECLCGPDQHVQADQYKPNFDFMILAKHWIPSIPA